MASSFHFIALVALISAPLVSAQEDGKKWSTPLYGPDWSATPALSFAKDKIIQDFSYAGYANGEKPIPDLAGVERFDVVVGYGADPTGKTDSTAAIQNAIDAAAAAGGAVVDLPAGTYRIQPAKGNRYALCVRNNGIVLRGAGREKTFLLNTSTEMREKAVILF
jgi:pectin methylesterase-like acyl-CoA thioesterase